MVLILTIAKKIMHIISNNYCFINTQKLSHASSDFKTPFTILGSFS